MIARTALLASIVIVAALQVLVTATTRPMLQVSDEINYLYSVQYTAAGQHRVEASLYPCLSPPDGNMLPLNPSGKVGDREVTARLLTASCRTVGAYNAFVVTRIALGLSLLVIVASGWTLATLACPRVPLLPAAVGAVLALHPVLVGYSAGITPDSWANAWAALAWVAAALMLSRPPGLRWLPPLTLFVLFAMLWKDTAHFLALLPVTLVPVTVWIAEPRRRRDVVFAVSWLICAAVVVAVREWLRSPYGLVGPFASRLWDAPLTVPSALLADVLPRVPDLFASSWTNWEFGQVHSLSPRDCSFPSRSSA